MAEAAQLDVPAVIRAQGQDPHRAHAGARPPVLRDSRLPVGVLLDGAITLASSRRLDLDDEVRHSLKIRALEAGLITRSEEHKVRLNWRGDAVWQKDVVGGHKDDTKPALVHETAKRLAQPPDHELVSRDRRRRHVEMSPDDLVP